MSALRAGLAVLVFVLFVWYVVVPMGNFYGGYENYAANTR